MRLVLVKEGEWGRLSSKRGDYDLQIELYTDYSSEFADVLLAETLADALKIIKSHGVEVVVFISRGMISDARMLKLSYPDLKVILLTGLPNWRETSGVIVVNKWDLTYKLWKQAVLN